MSEAKALARKIRERQRFIARIDKFFRKVVIGHGEMIRSCQGSCHTNTVWELKDFTGFTFTGDFGQTMFGGNGLRISHRGELVFHVCYQIGVEECEVRHFVEGPWIGAITKLFTTWRKELKKRGKKRKAEKEKKEAERGKMTAQEKLGEDAKRLGLKTAE